MMENKSARPRDNSGTTILKLSNQQKPFLFNGEYAGSLKDKPNPQQKALCNMIVFECSELLKKALNLIFKIFKLLFYYRYCVYIIQLCPN